MKLVLITLVIFLSLPTTAQKGTIRSDSISVSFNLTYALIAYSAGFELPFSNYSFAANANFNGKYDQGFYAGASVDRNIMVELRRYLKPIDDKERFLGVFSRYRFIDHVAPDKGEYSDDWFKSNQFDVGLMFGKRKYITNQLSMEGYIGGFVGWRDGIKRTDIRGTDQEFYQSAKGQRGGLMFKFKLSYELFNKKN